MPKQRSTMGPATIRAWVRFTTQEYTELYRRAMKSGMTRSAYIRHMSLGGKRGLARLGSKE